MMAAYAVQPNLRARGEREAEEVRQERQTRPPEEPIDRRVDGKAKPTPSEKGT